MSTKQKSKKGKPAPKQSPRYTIRVTAKQDETLKKMDRFQKRCVPGVMRKCLDTALANLNQQHQKAA